jgi:diguanylate cyclase (GGDEF)-like protein
MEDALAPSLLAAVRIMAREATLDARLTALASEAGSIAGGVGALTLLSDVDAGVFATPEGDALDLDAPTVTALRDATEERRASWAVRLPASLAMYLGMDQGSIVPLVASDETGPMAQGVMVVGGSAGADEDGTRDAILALADLAAIAIQQERLRTALGEHGAWQERVARTDQLTGLADRLTFLQMLELEVVRAARQGTALAVVVFAIDDLEGITRAQGGRTADDIVRVVAATLADGVRLVDTVARLGPDELGVIAPGDPTGTVARRVCEAVASLPSIGGVTPGVRAGVAHHPRDGADPADLLRAAQDAITLARAGDVGSIVGLRELADIEVGPTA